MPDLLAGSLIRAADWPPSHYQNSSLEILNISSTSYITGSTVVDFTFEAPTTGRVLLAVSLAATDSAGNRVSLAPEVYQGADATGSKILSADVGNRGVLSASTATNYGWWSRVTILEGLEPRALHYARTVHRVDGGSTADITFRDLSVMAVP